ncbi:hypothetical protein BH23BAC3_BH23BAC3_24490 [soil metagenome]
MGTTDTLQMLKHTDDEISSFLKNLSEQKPGKKYNLILLAGKNKSAKNDFIRKVKKQAGDQFIEIDLRQVISTIVEESKEKIDEMIKSTGTGKYVLLQNGDQLGGVYTGYSYSVRRYATPQERYLLKGISETDHAFFLDLDDIHTVNSLMKRHAQTLITFEYPSSLLGRLKQITVHGHTFASNRRARI